MSCFWENTAYYFGYFAKMISNMHIIFRHTHPKYWHRRQQSCTGQCFIKSQRALLTIYMLQHSKPIASKARRIFAEGDTRNVWRQTDSLTQQIIVCGSTSCLERPLMCHPQVSSFRHIWFVNLPKSSSFRYSSFQRRALNSSVLSKYSLWLWLISPPPYKYLQREKKMNTGMPRTISSI